MAHGGRFLTARPVPFTRFASETLGVKLTPGQKALASVAFDGVQPGALEGEARELARRIFGDIEEVTSLICWLASEECSFSTGAVFDVSGGRATY